MAQQTINIGAAPDDGTGDPLRTAFDKTNQNFDELYVGAKKTILTVRNSTGATIPAATLVFPNGSLVARPTVAIADKDTLTTRPVIGMTIASIADGADGDIQMNGQFGLDTTGLDPLDDAWLSTSGAITTTKPTSGAVVRVGRVTFGNSASGHVLLDLPAWRAEDAVAGPASQLDANGDILDVNTITSNRFLHRDTTNGIVGTKTIPAGVVVGTTDAQFLTQKTLSTNTNIESPRHPHATLSFAGGTESVTISTYNHVLINISADTTIDQIAGWGGPEMFHYATIEIVQDATGGHNIVWPSDVEWITGEAPDLANTEPNERVIVELMSRDAASGGPLTGAHNKSSLIRYSTATSETLLVTDIDKTVRCTNASAITFTIPSGLVMPMGATIAVRQGGAGQVTFVAGANVTLRSKGGLLSLDGEYAAAAIQREGTDPDTYWIGGDLV